MRAVVQRVKYASVKVDNQFVANIDNGLLVLAGVENDDNDEDITWLAKKIAQLRIFNDSEGVMNLSVNDINGDIIVVSQFTLHAST
ncbi:MAG: D-aminoacyl-tRNA deacylase, partial [Bacteroidales bacterium]|nr:D-aminoacyl-tRNA deacylase [Bacteroidales bacterium]